MESLDPLTSLYFPILITKLLQKNGIKFHSTPQKQSGNINASIILKMQKLTKTRKATKSMGTSTTYQTTSYGQATSSHPTYVPMDAFQKLMLDKLQGIETNFKSLEAYVKNKSMRAIGNQKLLASKLNLMVEAQVKIGDELNVEIEAGERVRHVYLESETEGNAEYEMEEDDEDGKE